MLECLSERFMSHSTATGETRSPAQMATIRARCPIERLAAKLAQDGRLDDARRAALQSDVEGEVARAIAFAEAAPFPDPGEALTDVG